MVSDKEKQAISTKVWKRVEGFDIKELLNNFVPQERWENEGPGFLAAMWEALRRAVNRMVDFFLNNGINPTRLNSAELDWIVTAFINWDFSCIELYEKYATKNKRAEAGIS